MTPRDVEMFEKLRLRTEADEATGCWNWTLGLTEGGYARGSGKVRGVSRLAHRLMYAAVHGQIPAGLEIDHLCRNRKCINPEHLEAVTPKVNTARSHSPSGLNARKTHCLNGHPFTPENTYLGVRGRRSCKTCVLRRSEEAALRKKAMSPAPPPKTHCVNGHEFTEENTYREPKRGNRHCRMCMRAAAARYAARKRLTTPPADDAAADDAAAARTAAAAALTDPEEGADE